MFVALVLAVVGDQDPGFSLWAEAEVWYAKPTGQMVITRGSRPGSGSIVHLGEDFGLERAWVPGGEIGASLGDHRVRLSYLDLGFTGTDTLDHAIIFHGVTYPQGEEVRSHIDFPRFSFAYDYDIWDTTVTKMWVGVVGHIYWLDAHLTSDTQDEHRTYSRGTAALTTSIDAFPGPVRITADGSLGYNTSSHEFIGGLRFMVRAQVWGPLAAGVGYRWEREDASGGTNVAALTVHGPTVVIDLRF